MRVTLIHDFIQLQYYDGRFSLSELVSDHYRMTVRSVAFVTVMINTIYTI